MERLRLQAARIAPHFRIALITGEPGTGKKALALGLHRLSNAPDGDFILRHAAEFADDPLEAARDQTVSTLYLFGAETLSLGQQDALLARLARSPFPGPKRTFDSRTVIGRVIVGSDVDLRGMVAAGRMHASFLTRVGTLEMRVPALRERLEDIESLAVHMLGAMGSRGRLSGSALAALLTHRWPGNLSELRSVLESVRELEGAIEACHLPQLADAAEGEPPLRLDDVMQRHVVEVLLRCAGNKLRAAEMLGISRSTLYRMLEGVAA